MGVNMEVIYPGFGGLHPQIGQKVKIHYIGTFLDGKKFDSSRDRGKPFLFVIGDGRVIRGINEGVAKMTKGERAKLTCLPKCACGAAGAGGVIPPNSTLVFDVELIDIH